MTPNEYQALAMRTANPECLEDKKKGLSDVGLGLAGEAGECADLIKKHLHQGHELDVQKLMNSVMCVGISLWLARLLVLTWNLFWSITP